MKKSTIAVAALLTALTTAPVMSVAYADDSSTTTQSGSTCAGKNCAGNCSGSHCSGSSCSGNCCGGKGSDE